LQLGADRVLFRRLFEVRGGGTPGSGDGRYSHRPGFTLWQRRGFAHRQYRARGHGGLGTPIIVLQGDRLDR
jgi:hypothetical protein